MRPKQHWTGNRKIVAPELRTSPDGIKHPSASHMRRYLALKLLESSGHITDLNLEVSFKLIVENTPILTPTGRTMIYTADFVYKRKRRADDKWVWVVEEHKGYIDDVSRMRIAIFEAAYKCKVLFTKYQ